MSWYRQSFAHDELAALGGHDQPLEAFLLQLSDQLLLLLVRLTQPLRMRCWPTGARLRIQKCTSIKIGQASIHMQLCSGRELVLVLEYVKNAHLVSPHVPYAYRKNEPCSLQSTLTLRSNRLLLLTFPSPRAVFVSAPLLRPP